MKKFLSLALALIMALSLVTVSAGATFTDAKDIKNTEAVEVMAALGILEGSNGTFNPQGTLTRGAAAKIIAYMVEGTAKAEAIKAAGVAEKPFPDVPTTSATAPFIAWAAEMDIVGGYNDGTFQRSNPVTGNAFVKMVLKALGVTDIDFTAKGWQIDAIARAVEMDLLEGIDEDVDFSKNLTRENAAQIAFNGMKYVPDGNKYYLVGTERFENATDAAFYAIANNTTVTPMTDLSKSLAGKNYKLAVVPNVQVTTTPETVYDQDYTMIGGAKYEIAASKELVGHYVNVYFKDSDGNGIYKQPTATTAGETVYGLVAQSKEIKVAKTTGLKAAEIEEMLELNEGVITATWTANSTQSVTGKVSNYVLGNGTTADVVKYEKTATYEGLTLKAGTYIVYNGNFVAVKSTSSSVDKYTITVDKKDNLEVSTGTGNNKVVVCADNADADLCKDIVLNEVDWAALLGDETTKSVALVTKKVGDYVTLTVPATVTGKVTKIDTSGSTDYIYIDGAKYQGNTGENDVADLYDHQFAWNAGFGFTTEWTFYLDGSNKVFAYGTEDEVTDGTLIIPTKIYAKSSYVGTKYDEYGELDEDAVSTYSIWLQAVNMAGEIVNLQIASTEEVANAANATALKNTADAAAAQLGTPYYIGRFANYTTAVVDDETIATITAVTNGGAEASQNAVYAEAAAALTSTSKKVIGGPANGGNSYYLSENYKVLYITKDGSDIEIAVKDGTYKQIVTNAMVYGVKEATDTNYELKYVLVKAGLGDDDGEGKIFIDGTLNKETAVPYTDANGQIQTGYENTVYIDGEKTTILTTATEADKWTSNATGFYTYKVSEQGLYTLTAYNTNAVVEKAITNVYNGLITTDGAEDIDATGAVIVNLMGNSELGSDDVPEAGEDLVKDANAKISFIFDNEKKTVSLIYVTDYTDQD